MLYNIPVNFRDFHLIKYVRVLSLFALLSFLIVSNYSITVYGQQEQQEQLDQQTAVTTNSPIDSICQLIQDNGLIAGLAGLDQATNICNNLNTIGSNQAALSELCSIVGGLNIINVESFCNQQDANQEQNQQHQQSQASNKGNQLPENNQEGAQSDIPAQSNTENQQQPSGSIIDRLFGMLFGFLNFGN